MNEPNSQHSDVKQDTEMMMAKVQDLLRDAYTSGYRAGYHKGFEFGVATVTDRKTA